VADIGLGRDCGRHERDKKHDESGEQSMAETDALVHD
jgi:hypothetical protein